MKKPTFLIVHGLLSSALIPVEQPHQLEVGAMLRLEQTFHTPWGPVPVGTRAYVEHVDENTGMVELLVTKYVRALEPWDRQIILMPYSTDDLAPTLRLLWQPRASIAPHFETEEETDECT